MLYTWRDKQDLKMEVQREDVSVTASRGDISLPESAGLSGSESDAEADISDILTTPTTVPGSLKYTPIGIESGTTSRSWTRSPHRAAELIHARSRILQLEGEVLGLQRAAKRARIEGDEREAGESLGEQVEQLHKVGGVSKAIVPPAL